jgi:heavy metal sensor kinase
MSRLEHWLQHAWEGVRSIRVRLTLWYVALLGLILVVFSAVLYLSLSRNLHDEVDRSLAAEAQRQLASLDVENGAPSLAEGPDMLQVGTVAVLYDRAGQHVLANDPRQPLPVLAEALARAAQGQETFMTTQLPSGAEWRVLTTPVVDNGMLIGVLQVARSEGEVDAALHQLALLMALAVPLTLLLASAGGLFLAGRALNPIDRITRAAAAISADDLSRRLDLRGSRDEVGRLAATFDRMLDGLDRAFRRQRQFTADASHELRTPLTMLTSQIDVALERRRSPEEYEQLLRSLREDAARLSQLLGELLTLARADAGQQLLTREPLDLGELVRSVVPAMQPLADQRGVRLTEQIRAQAPVLGDQTRLSQLVINLVDNGLRYTPAGGSVEVEVGQEGAWATLRVRDTGVGIAAEHLPRVFERFYRADPARSRADGGAGLGLAICRWIVEAHGGTIAVDSQLQHGSTFSVRLPLSNVTNREPPDRPAAALRSSRHQAPLATV